MRNHNFNSGDGPHPDDAIDALRYALLGPGSRGKKRDFGTNEMWGFDAEDRPAPTNFKSKLRFQIRPLKKSTTGQQSYGLGMRIGYGPCLRGPFIQITLFAWIIELWYGTNSYKEMQL